MYIKCIVASLLLMDGISRGELPSEVDNLRQHYLEARKKALDPIDQIYANQLHVLLNQLKDNPTEKDKIVQELKLLGETPVTEPVSAENKPQTVAANYVNDRVAVERFMNGKALKTPFGTTFHFERHGQGWKTTGKDRTTFIWKVRDDGVVEYEGRTTSITPVHTEYIKVVSTTKPLVFIGFTLDNIGVPLTVGR